MRLNIICYIFDVGFCLLFNLTKKMFDRTLFSSSFTVGVGIFLLHK